MKTEKPILFSTSMVQAILSGQKSQTRRILNPQPQPHHWEILPGYKRTVSLQKCNDGHLYARFQDFIPNNAEDAFWVKCPYGDVERLWVRESWRVASQYDRIPPRYLPHAKGLTVMYEAGGSRAHDESGEYVNDDSYPGQLPKWAGRRRPSIHMPRWASRINLDIARIQVEQLQSITYDDAAAEGAKPTGNASHLIGFKNLWDSINGKRQGCSWSDNPWVWKISFVPYFEGWPEVGVYRRQGPDTH